MIAMIAAIIEEKKSSAIILIIWKPLSSDCSDFEIETFLISAIIGTVIAMIAGEWFP